ncbi:MAG: sigma-70 family RNA polymerase sigma factor [Nibricoccus sp.]
MEGGVSLAGWLYVATKNAAANALRAEVRRVRREQEVFAMNERETSGGVGGMPGGGVSDEEVWAQVRPELEAVMDELGEWDREAVLLRFFEGRAFGEIGAMLRVSEDAARVRVNRALEKLRGLLARRGIKSTAAALGGLLAGNAAVAAPAGLAASVTGAALMSAGAMASGAAAGVGAAGILSFMTTTKIVTGVACAVAALSVGTAVWQYGEAERLRAELLALEKDGEASRRHAGELESRLGDAERRVLAQKASVEVLGKSKGEAAIAAAKPAVVPARTGLELMNVLYEDAGFQEASLNMFRASAKFKYAPFYRKMTLSAAQIAQLESALLEREQAQIDQNAAARSQKLSISDPVMGKVTNQGFADAYAEMERVLGGEGVKRFNEYEKAIGTQAEVQSVLSASLYSDAPLTLEQSERLSEILAANRLSEKNGNMTTYTGYKWDEIAVAAAEVLPGAQAAFVRDYVTKLKAEQLWQEYWRAAREGRPLSDVMATKGK